jgi:hypothetical protein
VSVHFHDEDTDHTDDEEALMACKPVNKRSKPDDVPVPKWGKKVKYVKEIPVLSPDHLSETHPELCDKHHMNCSSPTICNLYVVCNGSKVVRQPMYDSGDKLDTVEPLRKAKRWSAARKESIEVPQTAVTASYNAHMDGVVDLLDRFLFTYRPIFHSKK